MNTPAPSAELPIRDALNLLYPGLLPDMALNLALQLVNAPYPAPGLSLAVIQYGADCHAYECAELIGQPLPLKRLVALDPDSWPKYVRTEEIKPESIRLLSAASVSIQLEAGYLLLHGVTTPKDQHAAYNIFNRLAKAGNPQALDQRGLMYQHGVGTIPSAANALMDFQVAAGLQNPSAYYHLGVIYRNNAGYWAEQANISNIAEDKAVLVKRAGDERFAAWTLFIAAADAGIVEAHNSLGEMIIEHDGLKGLFKGRHFDWDTLRIAQPADDPGLVRPANKTATKPTI